PVNRVRPLRTIVRGLRRWLRLVAVVLILAGIVAAIAFPEAAWNAIQLPLFAFFSTTRMVVAYLFALVFAIAYGHTAATNKRATSAAVPKLVYNSILSWTNGWFFLVASEIFSAGGTEFQRPGLGAFIAVAGRNGDIPSIAIGIAVLATVVLTLDIFVWRPLGAWSER